MFERRLLSSGVRGGKQDFRSPNSTSSRKKIRSSKSLKSGESKFQKNKITKYIEKFNVPTEKVDTEVGSQTIQLDPGPVRNVLGRYERDK